MARVSALTKRWLVRAEGGWSLRDHGARHLALPAGWRPTTRQFVQSRARHGARHATQAARLSVFAQTGEELIAGNHLPAIRLSDTRFKFRQFSGRKTHIIIAFTREDKNLGSIPELRIVDRDLAVDNGACSDFHG